MALLYESNPAQKGVTLGMGVEDGVVHCRFVGADLEAVVLQSAGPSPRGGERRARLAFDVA